MANWTTSTPTRDQCFSDCYNYGEWRQKIYLPLTTGSADNGLATGAGITMARFPCPVTVPPVTSPTTGYVFTQFDIQPNTSYAGIVGGLEYLFGTLTVNGNSYSANAGMPTKTVLGSSVQLGSLMTLLAVSTTLTATTPTITFTYTNQAGTPGQTGTITLPTTAAIYSAFLLNRHLAAGDTGVQNITGLSISTGTAGVIKAYGVMPISAGLTGPITSAEWGLIEPLATPLPLIKCVPNDIISFYSFGQNAEGIADIIASPEQ